MFVENLRVAIITSASSTQHIRNLLKSITRNLRHHSSTVPGVPITIGSVKS